MNIIRRAAAVFTAIAANFNGLWGSGYHATDPRRKLISRMDQIGANRATANQLLTGSLPLLRSYCRNLIRNNPSAKAGTEAFATLLIGTGIAVQPDTGDEATDEALSREWERWLASAEVGGRSLYALQMEAAKELPQAGEAIWRLVVDPELSTYDNPIPARLVAYEGEWLVDGVPEGAGVSSVAGISLDKYGRPTAYYLQNPESLDGEVVPAKDIIHIFERKRAMQARGEPDLSSVIETLMNERDLVDLELYAAKQNGAMALVITSDAHPDPDTEEDGSPEDPAASVRIGGVARLDPGEKIESFSHNRPSQAIAPFRAMLRGDTAAAMRIPRRFLDRDVSGANYSSMRADMLDTERLLNPLRETVGHQVAGEVYRKVLPFLKIAAGITGEVSSKYRLIPDGQPYVDPMKDIQAAVAAIDANLSTYEAEVGRRGGDYRQIWAQRRKEKVESEGLPVSAGSAKPTKPAKPEVEDEDDEEVAVTELEPADPRGKEDMTRAETMMMIRAMQPAPAAPVQISQHLVLDEASGAAIGRALGASYKEPVIHVQAAAAPVVNVAAPNVSITQAAQAAPVVNVTNDVRPSAVAVQVAAPDVTVNNTVEVPQRPMKATPNPDGSVTLQPVEG